MSGVDLASTMQGNGPQSKKREDNMKRLFFVFAGICLAAVAAYAGGLADGLLNPGEVVSSQGGADSLPAWILPAAVIVVLAALISASDSGS